jgi:hypothetical protein
LSSSVRRREAEGLIVLAMAMFLLNAAAIPVAITSGQAAEFGPHHDPQQFSWG